MDREKIEEEFHRLLDEVADGIEEKLDIGKAVKRRSSSSTAARMASDSSRVRENIIRPEIKKNREDLKHQFSRVIDLLEDDEDVEAIREELLENDIFHQNMKRESPELEEKIINRFENLRHGLERIKQSEEDEVWQGVRQQFTEEEAREFINEMFGFLEEVQDHEKHLEYRKDIDLSKISSLLPFSVEVDYTPEALEVMEESEDEVREKLERKLDDLYSEESKNEDSGDNSTEDSGDSGSEVSDGKSIQL